MLFMIFSIITIIITHCHCLKFKIVALFQDGLNTSGETDNDIPKFITDSNEKTSYVRGKFLGKVSCWLDICIPCLAWLWRCPCVGGWSSPSESVSSVYRMWTADTVDRHGPGC